MKSGTPLTLLLFILLCSSAWAQAELTIEYSGEVKRTLTEVSEEQIVKELSHFLRSKKSGVFHYLITDQSVRYTKVGDSVTQTHTASAEDMFQEMIGVNAEVQLNTCRANLKELGAACEMYFTEFDGKYPGSIYQLYMEYLLSPKYCPESDSESDGYSYQKLVDPKYGEVYEFRCNAEHSYTECPKGYPRWNGLEGFVMAPR